jgi:hypothetical protein
VENKLGRASSMRRGTGPSLAGVAQKLTALEKAIQEYQVRPSFFLF